MSEHEDTSKICQKVFAPTNVGTGDRLADTWSEDPTSEGSIVFKDLFKKTIIKLHASNGILVV